MPHKDKKAVLIRQWEMLRVLGSQWKKASEIAARLEDEGHEVSVRTVQRDLKELSLVFPIELNDKNPRDYGWRWMKGAHLDVPGMSISEALAMRLVETHLKQMMPSSMLEALQGLFLQAKSKLDQTPKSAGWLQKVKVVQSGQPLLPPNIDQAVQDAVYAALLGNKKISAVYRSPWMEERREYTLNPLGLIMRGPVSYLVATAWEYEDTRLYAMHRLEVAEILEEVCKIPEGFDLDKAIDGGFADFSGSGGSVHLELMCDEENAAYLVETPLSEDQEIGSPDGGWMRIRATVNDTWQLRWWLLSKGSGIEVLSPGNLRKEIAQELAEASHYYTDAGQPELGGDDRAIADKVNALMVERFGQRDAARIPVVLNAIREKWEKEPDLRLGQLIVNAISPSEPCPQVYNFEDGHLISKL